MSYLPLIGEPLRNFLLGGPEVSGATLTNFYGLHVAILPLTLIGIVSFHIWRVRKDTLTIPHNVDGTLARTQRQGDHAAPPGLHRVRLCAGDDRA